MFEAEWSLDNKPHTRTKLEIFKKYFDVWLKIWNNQNWVSNTWYYIDLYSGRGIHNYKGENCYGSPLIFLDQLRNKLTDNSVEFKSSLNIHMFLVEEDKRTFTCLKENVDAFLQENPVVSNFVSIYYFNNDCNIVIDEILSNLINNKKNPLLAVIDPYGINVDNATLGKIVSLANPKEILFNYILEGVRRVSGVVKKSYSKEIPTKREISTIKTFHNFIGHNQNIIGKNDIEILESFVKVFLEYELKVVAYDMKYPDRRDVIYYLLFASKKDTIKNIMKDIFAREKERVNGPTLFGGKDYYEQGLLSFEE